MEMVKTSAQAMNLGLSLAQNLKFPFLLLNTKAIQFMPEILLLKI